jgi:hypothetical protein
MRVEGAHPSFVVRGFVTVVTTYPSGCLKLNQSKSLTASSFVEEKTVSKAQLTGTGAKILLIFRQFKTN